MYLVDCPNCGRSLRMKRAVAEAKLKCRYCRAVFVGSTRLSPEVTPHVETLPVPAPRPEASSYHRLPKRRVPPLLLILTVFGLIGAILLGVWLYHYVQQNRATSSAQERSFPAEEPRVPDTAVVESPN